MAGKEKYRNVLFDTMNKLKDNKEFDGVRNVITNLFATKSKEQIINKRQILASSCAQLHSQFYGFLIGFNQEASNLLTGENISLEKYEKMEIEKGHFLINSFLMKALDDLENKIPGITFSLSPYSKFNQVKLENNFDSSLSVCIDKLVNSFKKTTVYSKVLNSLSIEAFSKMAKEDLYKLVLKGKHNLIDIDMKKVPSDVQRVKLTISQKKIADRIYVDLCNLVALKEMIALTCNELYLGILNSPLFIIDEEKLVNIVENCNNILYKFMDVIIDGFVTSKFNNDVGQIILFNFERESIKIKEFGQVRSISMNFSKDYGVSTEIVFCIVDDELNPIFTFTD